MRGIAFKDYDPKIDKLNNQDLSYLEDKQADLSNTNNLSMTLDGTIKQKSNIKTKYHVIDNSGQKYKIHVLGEGKVDINPFINLEDNITTVYLRRGNKQEVNDGSYIKVKISVQDAPKIDIKYKKIMDLGQPRAVSNNLIDSDSLSNLNEGTLKANNLFSNQQLPGDLGSTQLSSIKAETVKDKEPKHVNEIDQEQQEQQRKWEEEKQHRLKIKQQEPVTQKYESFVKVKPGQAQQFQEVDQKKLSVVEDMMNGESQQRVKVHADLHQLFEVYTQMQTMGVNKYYQEKRGLH